MVFNSIHFLLFFPVVTLVYFLLPHRARWVWLLAASYYFYMAWNPKYALLLAGITLITYWCGRMLPLRDAGKPAAKPTAWKKLWLAVCVALNLGALFFFKYFTFAFENMALLLSRAGIQVVAPAFDMIMPVGISFFIFQTLGYVIDVYRGVVGAQRNLAKYALFVSFFPQMLSGPIGRAKDLLPQIAEEHFFSYEQMKSGLLRMLWGFFQKMVIADRAAVLVNTVYAGYRDYAGFEIAVAVFLYAVQIYCDFSGYSDIALGAAQVMGFRLAENFRQPYFAVSVQDFWRRWHISLSTWFRDYLYIPLGGSRGSKARKYLNRFITFLASGLWHGVGWNFLLWGGLHGAFQIAGEITGPAKEKLCHALRIDSKSVPFVLLKRVITFTLVAFAWIFFRAPTLGTALRVIKRMITVYNPWVLFDGSLYTLGLTEKSFHLLLVAILVLFAVNYLQTKFVVRQRIQQFDIIFRWAIYFAGIFSVLIFGVYGPGYNAGAFLYFQF